jgi:hypothetical protein
MRGIVTGERVLGLFAGAKFVVKLVPPRNLGW